MQSRPTWVDVDLDAIAHNYRVLRSRLRAGTLLLAQAKGNAYGHGLVEVARAYERLGADWLGVACIDEAARLRDGGVTKPILVQAAILPEEAEAVLDYDAQPAVGTFDVAEALDRAAAARGMVAPIHLKVDTGMGRWGVWHEELLPFLERVLDLEHVRIAGCCTHLPSAEEDRKFTDKQVRLFRGLVEGMRDVLDGPILGHAANSMAVLAYPEAHLDLVRPGLALFGLYPTEALRGSVHLEPALVWKTRVAQLRPVAAGRTVSYGRTHTTRQATRIAVLPVGYADGYPRALSNRSVVLVRGRRAPVVGRVCMDALLVDVGGVPDAHLGDEVTLIGRQGAEAISAEELARRAGTISYEIVARISDRVPRQYLSADAAPGDETLAAHAAPILPRG